jgi:hypothetical protein
MSETLPERACGDCTVCCTHLTIDTPAFAKIAGVTCENCGSQGCAIYETRYEICRTYRCGWKHATWLAEAMRPDRCGIIIDFTEPDAAGYELEARLLAWRDPDDFERNPVPDVISSLIENQVMVQTARPGPSGAPGAKTAVNMRLGEAIRTRNLPLFLAELRAGVRALETRGPPPGLTSGA